MNDRSANFEFLRTSDERMVRLAIAAERYFSSDAAAALVKLRALAEQLARHVCAHHALLINKQSTFDDILHILRERSILSQWVTELLYHAKRVGNAAAHGDLHPRQDHPGRTGATGAHRTRRRAEGKAGAEE